MVPTQWGEDNGGSRGGEHLRCGLCCRQRTHRIGGITDRSLMDASVESLFVTCGCCDVDAGIFVDLLLGYECRYVWMRVLLV